MKKWLTELLIGIITDERTQTMIRNLLSSVITEKIAPLVPLAAASAAKAIAEAVPGLKEAGDVLGDVVSVAEKTRQDLNALIPDIDIGIPILDNFVDAWRPR